MKPLESEGNYARRIKQIRRALTAIVGMFWVLTTKAQSIDDAQTAPQVAVPTIIIALPIVVPMQSSQYRSTSAFGRT
jgi:hypothetical protein